VRHDLKLLPSRTLLQPADQKRIVDHRQAVFQVK
jgi:hypothetical protein